jgi:putative membrane protein
VEAIQVKQEIMKKGRLLWLALMMVAGFMACDKNNDEPDTMNAQDKQFMEMASYGNHNEIEAGRLASSRGMADSIENFGDTMVVHHTMAQDMLEDVAGMKSLNIPQGPDPAHVAMKAYLQTLSGRAFDSAYIHSQVLDHQATVDLFQNEINNGNDVDVRNYASENLPTIQMHLQMAMEMAERY